MCVFVYKEWLKKPIIAHIIGHIYYKEIYCYICRKRCLDFERCEKDQHQGYFIFLLLNKVTAFLPRQLQLSERKLMNCIPKKK